MSGRGVFLRLWQVSIKSFDEISASSAEPLHGIAWAWLSMDRAMKNAPLDRGKTGSNPTDRGETGVKRHDMKLTRDTQDSVVVAHPEPNQDY